MKINISPKSHIRGSITVPGDKSISHRAVMLGSIADGITYIDGFLMGADCLSTIACFKELGVSIDVSGQSVCVHGVDMHGLKPPTRPLDVGNSGTTIRLLSGILAAQRFTATLTGDASILSRPMMRVVAPLRQMGAEIDSPDGGVHAPLTINGKPLHGINYTMPVASAQVKSAILLAGLYADGPTTITEPYPSRDHTELMLKAMGIRILADEPDFEGSRSITIWPAQGLHCAHINIPGDISSAAFIITAAMLCAESHITIQNVGINPTRTGILEAYKDMGADIAISNRRLWNMEQVADISVGTSHLHGVTISGSIIPRLIDEIPILAIAASLAEGITIIKDVQELRVKESDRIAAISHMLRNFGVEADTTDDSITIKGKSRLKGCHIDPKGDHRIAMAAAIAGLAADSNTSIEGAECVEVSFPGFFELLNSLGY
ncbi:3-phosphoshikimate 1-carboxyvinyltransferase [Mahella sp.]|uniref:3-phosphoshikimate 1-carboxyvinyltransferase n=1 Tax=Mahella sp. TaxID=2798721 RepID=UPI0025BCC838|nr:3-phosphoshikimate 1-carboxyvinyltransferase [Mahella sp.]MBZ4666204.1 3-phosphoshikimate 1-carboxyvinyltransferase [Mahella sp.]MDK2902844.1 3-phosphoshikimate 1-carboxyvinyltransferase [Clostridiales bacterium]